MYDAFMYFSQSKDSNESRNNEDVLLVASWSLIKDGSFYFKLSSYQLNAEVIFQS